MEGDVAVCARATQAHYEIEAYISSSISHLTSHVSHSPSPSHSHSHTEKEYPRQGAMKYAMHLPRTLAPLEALWRPRTTPWSSIRSLRSIASASAAPPDKDKHSTPPHGEKPLFINIPVPKPMTLRHPPAKGKVDDTKPSWWRRMDARYGPGWEAFLPAPARVLAEAQRRIAFQTSADLAEQSLQYKRLFLRLDETDALVTGPAATLNRHINNIRALVNQTYSPLRRMRWFKELEEAHGTRWGEVAQEAIAARKARRECQRQGVSQHRICYAAFRQTNELIVHAEQALARTHWHDELEREHGDGWGQIAEERSTQWTDNWNRSSPAAFPHLACWVALSIGERLRWGARKELGLLELGGDTTRSE